MPPEPAAYPETRSKRRMTRTRRIAWRIVSSIGVGLVRMFWATCRVVRVVGDEHMAKALSIAPSVIPVYWHQHQLFCAKYLLEQSARFDQRVARRERAVLANGQRDVLGARQRVEQRRVLKDHRALLADRVHFGLALVADLLAIEPDLALVRAQ